MSYNSEHAASVGFVDDVAANLWSAMKVWVQTNVDTSNIMQVVKSYLDTANREVIGTTGTQKAQAVVNSINAIATVLSNAGVPMSGVTLAQFAEVIRKTMATGYEVCILGKSGTHYTPAQWNEYIAEHGTEPENGAQVAVITPFQSFVIANTPVSSPTSYVSRTWGNITDTVQGLYGSQTGSFINVLQNSLNFKSLENTYRMLLWYNPEVLPHINYDPADPTIDYGGYACIRFTTYDEMNNSDQHLMMDQQVYIVTNDETDSTTNQCYYWNGASYSKRFAVPRVMNNITGSPAAEYAWTYKAYDGDTRQYCLPTINHLLMMYVYYTEINECLSALNHSTLPSGNTWSCQQNSFNVAYYVTIPTGSVNNNGSKNNAYAVVPVAAL